MFFQILKDKFHFSNEELESSKQYFENESLAPKHFFVQQGKIAEKFGVVQSGLFRTFFIDENGDDITTAFHEPNTLLLSINSFNNQVKSKENIVAIEQSEIMSVSYNNWLEMNKNVPKWEEVRAITGDYMGMQLQSRAREFQTLSAKERYQKFCKKHPLVIQKATLGHIASYLGIDIATLSRIRKKA